MNRVTGGKSVSSDEPPSCIMPLGPTDFVWIGLVPCALAAGLVWIGAAVRLRTTALWALSVGVAVFLGMAAQHLRDGSATAADKLFHPRVHTDWLPWLVLLAAMVTVLAAYTPREQRRWVGGLACLFAIAVPMRLLASNALAMARWTFVTKLAVLVGWGSLLTALWTTLALGRRNGQPLLRSSLIVVAACGTAVTLAASGSITFGEYGGIVAAALFGAVAVAWWTDRFADGPSPAAGPLAVALLGLILLGCSYDLSPTNAALLLLSIAASAGWLPESWPTTPRWRGAARLALTLIPLTLAAASAILTSAADPYG
jgi:hypothetical protein